MKMSVPCHGWANIHSAVIMFPSFLSWLARDRIPDRVTAVAVIHRRVGGALRPIIFRLPDTGWILFWWGCEGFKKSYFCTFWNSQSILDLSCLPGT